MMVKSILYIYERNVLGKRRFTYGVTVSIYLSIMCCEQYSTLFLIEIKI